MKEEKKPPSKLVKMLTIAYMIGMTIYTLFCVAMASVAFVNMKELKDKLDLLSDNLL